MTEFRGADTRVYEMLFRIMDEFDISEHDLEEYREAERCNYAYKEAIERETAKLNHRRVKGH
jgi:hypothetical protein